MQSSTRSTMTQFCGFECSSWNRADDEELHKGYGFPTFSQWPETLHTVENCNLTTVKVDQGSLDHPTTKPTTLLTDIEAIKGVDGWKTQGQPEKWPQELEKRIQFSKELATWAAGLKGLLRMAIQTMVKALTLKEQNVDYGVEGTCPCRSSTFSQGL